MVDSVSPGNDLIGAQQVHSQQSMGTPDEGGNKWHNYFGPSSSEIKTNAYDKYAYETYDLPEAYKGRNLFLRDTIDGFIMDDNEWYTRVALPFAQTNDIHLSWNEWHFNQTLAGRVPHEGVSRLITSSKRQFKDHTVRRGLAFILEHGFMNTAEGREQYRRNLRGIKQCVQETANHDVVSAYLNARNYDKEWERRHGLYNRPVREIMRREVNEWAIVQKNIEGLEILHEEYKKRLSRYGVKPSLWIFPPKMCMYAAMVPPTAGQALGQVGPGSFKAGEAALGNFRGVNVYETRLFDVYENELPVDLLRREQQIGEYYTMTNTCAHLEHARPANGTSGSRDIIIYDESVDNWRRIEWKVAVCAAAPEACAEARARRRGGGGGGNDDDDDDDDDEGSIDTSARFGTLGDWLTPKQLREYAKTNESTLKVPSFIHKRIGSRVAGRNSKYQQVSAAAERAFVTKNGQTGLYVSAITEDGKVGTPVVGDTKALFVNGVSTQKGWKTVDIKSVIEETPLEERPTSIDNLHDLVKECHEIVREFESPVRNVGQKRERINSRGGYGTKRQKTVDELLDNVFEERGINSNQMNNQLTYAKKVIGVYNQFVGAKVMKHDLDTKAGVKAAVTALERAEPEHEHAQMFEILLLRPYMTYNVSSAILTKGGYETGATFVGHSDFILGDDVVSKLHYGNFTFYSKAVVQNPRNVIIARNIFCQGYVGGNDCKFYKETEDGKKLDVNERGSLIAVLLPAGECKKLPNPLDITGRFNNEGVNSNATPHYPGAKLQNAKYGFDKDQKDLADDYNQFRPPLRSRNTVCFRGHQWSFDPSTGSHKAVTVNTGHWGPNVYPGCGRVRAGEMKYLEKQNYQQAIFA